MFVEDIEGMNDHSKQRDRDEHRDAKAKEDIADNERKRPSLEYGRKN